MEYTVYDAGDEACTRRRTGVLRVTDNCMRY